MTVFRTTALVRTRRFLSADNEINDLAEVFRSRSAVKFHAGIKKHPDNGVFRTQFAEFPTEIIPLRRNCQPMHVSGPMMSADKRHTLHLNGPDALSRSRGLR